MSVFKESMDTSDGLSRAPKMNTSSFIRSYMTVRSLVSLIWTWPFVPFARSEAYNDILRDLQQLVFAASVLSEACLSMREQPARLSSHFNNGMMVALRPIWGTSAFLKG